VHPTKSSAAGSNSLFTILSSAIGIQFSSGTTRCCANTSHSKYFSLDVIERATFACSKSAKYFVSLVVAPNRSHDSQNQSPSGTAVITGDKQYM
jgi:hypothetical protein